MLSMDNYRAITDSFLHNQADTFGLFLDYLSRDQLRLAREFVDRQFDRQRRQESGVSGVDVSGFRQMVVRRQFTIQ
jgi:hypothetical protein